MQPRSVLPPGGGVETMRWQFAGCPLERGGGAERLCRVNCLASRLALVSLYQTCTAKLLCSLGECGEVRLCYDCRFVLTFSFTTSALFIVFKDQILSYLSQYNNVT